jgi:hypothetical protein
MRQIHKSVTDHIASAPIQTNGWAGALARAGAFAQTGIFAESSTLSSRNASPGAAGRHKLLPHDIPHFTDRTTELGILDSLLAANRSKTSAAVMISTIAGTPDWVRHPLPCAGHTGCATSFRTAAVRKPAW